MASKLLPFLLLLTSALATPVANPEATPTPAVPTKPFTISTFRRYDSNITEKIINAASRSLYLDLLLPNTYCPMGYCPPGNSTVFTGLLKLDVQVSGGQTVYVASDGALGYTEAFKHDTPAGSSTTGFKWNPLLTEDAAKVVGEIGWAGEIGELDFELPDEKDKGKDKGKDKEKENEKEEEKKKRGFWACPSESANTVAGKYKLYAKVPGFVDEKKQCYWIGKLLTKQFKIGEFGAYQYN